MTYKCGKCLKFFAKKDMVLGYRSYCKKCSVSSPQKEAEYDIKNSELIELIYGIIDRMKKGKTDEEIKVWVTELAEKKRLEENPPEFVPVIDTAPLKDIQTYKNVKTGQIHKCSSYDG